MRLGHVIHHAEDHDGSQYHDAVVHRRGGGGCCGGPEAEEEDDEHVDDAANIHGDAGPSGDPPRAPG